MIYKGPSESDGPFLFINIRFDKFVKMKYHIKEYGIYQEREELLFMTKKEWKRRRLKKRIAAVLATLIILVLLAGAVYLILKELKKSTGFFVSDDNMYLSVNQVTRTGKRLLWWESFLWKTVDLTVLRQLNYAIVMNAPIC